ncbi:hypothetical protein B4119_4285 [Parageobacillus caldoxylosilyticus]|uniref:Uncharacterized protein n=1 Tax=Saccharococcus caldoxylosilyticus TaxID=81408 RepID=A0A150L7G9_9BACL|nr:hypothetical protein B4119_4285 [Parageobacillus caldoxylosilyticus]
MNAHQIQQLIQCPFFIFLFKLCPLPFLLFIQTDPSSSFVSLRSKDIQKGMP